MRFEDAKLLREWALIQFDRVAPRVAALDVTVDRARIHKSVGFKKLRSWFVRLSPAARDRARQWMRQQVTAVRTVLAQAAANGEELSVADIEDINFITNDGDDDDRDQGHGQDGRGDDGGPAGAEAPGGQGGEGGSARADGDRDADGGDR